MALAQEEWALLDTSWRKLHKDDDGEHQSPGLLGKSNISRFRVINHEGAVCCAQDMKVEEFQTRKRGSPGSTDLNNTWMGVQGEWTQPGSSRGPSTGEEIVLLLKKIQYS